MLIRAVSREDEERIREVWNWPLRDLMLAYIERLRESAWRSYQLDMLVWSALAPHQRRKTDPPAIPRVLRS